MNALLAVAVIAAGVWAMLPALRGGWIWDDSVAVVQNSALRGAGGLKQIWFAPPGPDYFPLTSTVQWVQWQLWGLRSTGYHLTNLMLHLAGAFLLWRSLAKLGVACGWVAALLFTVHPVTVESVAWISELKNVLSLPPLLLAFDAYLDFDRDRRRPDRLQALGWFLISLLCKSSVVMFPVLLLVYAFWRRGRLERRDWWGTLPFFVASLGFGLLTLWFQAYRAAGAAPLTLPSWPGRLLAATRALAFYFAQAIWPHGLVPMYPAAVPASRWALALGFTAVLIGIAARSPSWRRHLQFGLAWFVINLLPVLGFLPMVYLRIAPVADHLAYLPLVGLCALAAAGFAQLARACRGLLRPIPALLCAGVILICCAQSHSYAAEFKDERTLWTYTLDCNPAAWQADLNLGCLLLDGGKRDEAIAHFRRALITRPDYPEAENDLGNALAAAGRFSEAILTFREAIQLDPSMPELYYNLGNALMGAARPVGAIASFETALRLHAHFPEAENSLGIALARTGHLREAVEHFQAALRLDPAYEQARGNLAIAQKALARGQ